jgi:hypothetical protein
MCLLWFILSDGELVKQMYNREIVLMNPLRECRELFSICGGRISERGLLLTRSSSFH